MKPIPDHYRNLVRLPGKRQGKPRGSGNAIGLPTGSPALVNAQPFYANKMKVAGSDGRNVLKSGHNNSKIGRVVVKGAWRGYPIYTLSLAERTTCPTSCVEWRTCYGNHMPWADRYLPGEELTLKLTAELSLLHRKHPSGFVIRLHVLGDFYSIEYVEFWLRAMRVIPALHVFGYSAHQPGTPIGDRLDQLRHEFGKRFSLRFSNGTRCDAPISRTDYRDLPMIKRDLSREDILCPAQQGTSLCCATCALCWDAPAKTIVFERH